MSAIPCVAEISASTLHCLRALIFIVVALNVIGNSLLIYALIKTGQTKTISLKFIIIMSVSDLIIGIVGLPLLSLMLWDKYHSYCLLKIITQCTMFILNPFSFTMVVLIALDRYLHMTCLTQYQSLMNKTRAHCMVFCALCICVAMAGLYLLLSRLCEDGAAILQCISVLCGVPLFATIFSLYYKAYQNLQLQASSQLNQFVRRTLSDSKKFAVTARQILVSATLLTMPVLLSFAFNAVKSTKYKVLSDHTTLDIFTWFGTIINGANAFSSSLIFMMHNKRVKQWLKTMILGNRVGVDVENDV